MTDTIRAVRRVVVGVKPDRIENDLLMVAALHAHRHGAGLFVVSVVRRHPLAAPWLPPPTWSAPALPPAGLGAALVKAGCPDTLPTYWAIVHGNPTVELVRLADHVDDLLVIASSRRTARYCRQHARCAYALVGLTDLALTG